LWAVWASSTNRRTMSFMSSGDIGCSSRAPDCAASEARTMGELVLDDGDQLLRAVCGAW
jgi:hypothetical protein